MPEQREHLSFWLPSLQEIAVNLASVQTGSESEDRAGLPTSKTMNKQCKFFMPGRISLMSVKCLESSAIKIVSLRHSSANESSNEIYKGTDKWRHWHVLCCIGKDLQIKNIGSNHFCSTYNRNSWDWIAFHNFRQRHRGFAKKTWNCHWSVTLPNALLAFS